MVKNSFEAPSAKRARGVLEGLGAEGSSLVVLASRDRNAWLSFRNFPRVGVKTAAEVNAYDVCRYRNLLVTEEAWERLRDRACGEREATP